MDGVEEWLGWGKGEGEEGVKEGLGRRKVWRGRVEEWLKRRNGGSGGMVGVGEGGGRFGVGGWMEWRKVKEEEGSEWGNGRSGGMVKEEE